MHDTAPDCTTIALFRRPFWFVRHGETEANRLALIAGSSDVPLNATGEAQAARAAAAASGLGVTSIHASPLRRARATAEAFAAATGLPVAVVPELAERNWGELEGRPRALRVRGVTPPGGESPEAFQARVARGLARIDDPGLPMIVAHSGIYRVLVRLLGCPEPDDPVENCRPLRFFPLPEGRWQIEPAPLSGDAVREPGQ